MSGLPHNGLIVTGVTKVYGKTRVLDAVSFDVRPGEVLALLGENGAGKSTISNIIAGGIAATSGRMEFNGKLYAPTHPKEAIASGIRLIHQEIRLLPELSIAENIFVGFHLKKKSGRVDMREMERVTAIQLQRLGLDISPKTKVKTLSVAAQQQVEIAKSLTLNARLLILDEPTAALGGKEVEHLFARIRALKGEGTSFLYISHRLQEIARIADRVVLLRDGSLINVHESAQIPIEKIVTEMVGRSVDKLFPDIAEPSKTSMLEVKNLSCAFGAFDDISFSVRAGEVLGIAGIVGAGRSELVLSLFGARPRASGEVTLEGRSVTIRSPRDAIAAGIVLVPEDRKQQALIIDQVIGDNVACGNFDKIARYGFALPAKVDRFCQAAISAVGVKGSIHSKVGSLSGGNQQKVVIAKWIARNPKVLILDEPTRGIDVGARAAIYEMIARLARKGMAVVVVSSDLEEVLGLSNRVMVLANGRSQGVYPVDRANKIRVMELMTR